MIKVDEIKQKFNGWLMMPEKYREEDDKVRERVNGRNRLETYLYSCKQAQSEELQWFSF